MAKSTERFADDSRALLERAAQWFEDYLHGEPRESCSGWLRDYYTLEARELAAPHLERERESLRP